MFAGQDRNDVMLEKVKATGEPYFLLRAQDALASAIVLEWCDRAEGAGMSSDRVAEARICARQMKAWPKKKLPD